ncbi:MAG: PolC-type DNA polymerase III [Tepidanaerobacteraceae bacterium]|jgi:DNA polymerase-3 subunit alpha (Gram-positive type)|nr:PolC-type DNA polymerase III [Tepidanaerobacteraceae bacterium]
MITFRNILNKDDLIALDDSELKSILNIFITRVQIDIKRRKLEIFLEQGREIGYHLHEEIKKLLYEKIPGCKNIDICFDNKNQEKVADPKEIINYHWQDILEHVFAHAPSLRLWLLNASWDMHKDQLIIYVDKSGLEFLERKKCRLIIEKYLKVRGLQIKVSIRQKAEDAEEYDVFEEDREIVENMLSNYKDIDNREQDDINGQGILLGKLITDEPILIKDVLADIQDITIQGEIFGIEKRDLKNGTVLITFALTDYTGSIPVKIFLSGGKKAIGDKIKEGCWIKAKGKSESNKYSQELEFIPYDINISQKPARRDNCQEKRVELHLHTRYSAMDAVCSVKQVIEQVKSWGHRAVAFTDHGVIQSFPEVYEHARGSGIKPIYGVEAYIFDDEFPVMINPPDIKFAEATFVVADIETTGLSFEKDEIIEIGAVKIKDGDIIDRFSSFIKPSRTLPTNIINLTGITNEMVINAPPLKEVLSNFIDFLGDGIFVAHNAHFDSGFIRRDCEKFGLRFVNAILDTLPLCQILYTDLKNHRLDTVAKKLEIKMGNHHRAVDDANTAALILKSALHSIEKSGIDNLSNINRIYNLSEGQVHLNSYHATVLVKNMAGLKNLYRLVSISHLDYFYRHPRIPKSLLKSYREGLILGTGCQAGELFQGLLHYFGEDHIERIVDFYDFLEIQPLQNNAFLIKNGLVSGRETLKKLNIKIYELGKRFNKPVLLTGDVHFINPEDEIYRKVLLNSQGYEDADKDSFLYLKTTEEMLDECEYLGKEAAFEVVVTNTNKIAEEIDENIKPVPDELYPPKIEGAEQEIINMTYKRAKELYGENLPNLVQKRIERELNSIVNHGYSVIYLIAHKLVKKSLEDGYLVGSRGSVGSSLVATMCGITEVNPLPPHYLCPDCKHSIFVEEDEGIVGPDLPDKTCPRCAKPMKKEGFNIPFEVFMGFEGDKVPDIDLNFSGEYQARAHKFTEELFGSQHVFRAGTISTIAEKTAFGFVKSFMEEKKIKTSAAEIKRLAAGITGVKRTTGQHPGGLMVVPRDMEIYEFTPVQFPADDKESGVITTHFDYHSISSRLLKLDLLGHDDPTVIKMLEEETGIDAKKIPLDDKDTMEIFSSLKSLNLDPESVGTTVGTLGVPEFGTRFVRQMLEDTRPSTFAELVRISGLSHGTDVWLNNAQDLIRSKTATLKDVIATRDDIMIYLLNQGVEPKIAFNIMENVRKGKGIKPEHEEILIKNKKVASWFVESCKKIKYLFPKAHAVAYVIMAFRIAYFKVHYPEAFYATYFTVRADDFDAELILQGPKKIREAIAEIEKKEKESSAKEKNLLTILEVANEMYMRGIQFVPIDLYKSDIRRFKITPVGILPPLTSLQGLGLAAAQSIEEERKKGKFSSIEDLRQRTRITKNVIQILKQNGIISNLQETNQLCLF